MHSVNQKRRRRKNKAIVFDSIRIQNLQLKKEVLMDYAPIGVGCTLYVCVYIVENKRASASISIISDFWSIDDDDLMIDDE
jgi:hypothetical protein